MTHGVRRDRCGSPQRHLRSIIAPHHAVWHQPERHHEPQRQYHARDRRLLGRPVATIGRRVPGVMDGGEAHAGSPSQKMKKKRTRVIGHPNSEEVMAFEDSESAGIGDETVNSYRGRHCATAWTVAGEEADDDPPSPDVGCWKEKLGPLRHVADAVKRCVVKSGIHLSQSQSM